MHIPLDSLKICTAWDEASRPLLSSTSRPDWGRAGTHLLPLQNTPWLCTAVGDEAAQGLTVTVPHAAGHSSLSGAALPGPCAEGGLRAWAHRGAARQVPAMEPQPCGSRGRWRPRVRLLRVVETRSGPDMVLQELPREGGYPAWGL